MASANSIKYVGVNDKNIDLFEGQYTVPNGMSYNSYVILDEQIAVMDSVDIGFTDEWLQNILNATDGKSPDYLIVQHMEPDHSASIHHFTQRFPEAKIVATKKAFVMMRGFFGTDYPSKKIEVGEGDVLSLGKHTLNFITAPMVHWPEVMVTYDSFSKVIFSADAFGKFGALDTDEEWTCEARRYYIGIVGKFGAQVQSLLKKISGLDISAVYPLHGPMLTENLGYYISLYNTWSSYAPEEDGVVIAYTSVYGNTRTAVNLLRDELKKLGYEKISMHDLARCDMAEAVEDAFRYSKLVLATTTYNADIFPFMKEFINHLTERNYQNRQVSFIENGSWAPMAAKVMKSMLENSKNLEYTENNVKVISALNDESRAAISALAKEISK